MKRNIFFVFIKRKKQNSSASEMKCPKSGICINNDWVGESGKAVLNETVTYNVIM